MAFIDFSKIGTALTGSKAFDAAGNITHKAPSGFMEGAKNVFQNLWGDGGYSNLQSQYDKWKDSVSDKPPATWKEQAERMKKRLSMLEEQNDKKQDFKNNLLDMFKPKEQPKIEWTPIDIPVNPPQTFED